MIIGNYIFENGALWIDKYCLDVILIFFKVISHTINIFVKNYACKYKLLS